MQHLLDANPPLNLSIVLEEEEEVETFQPMKMGESGLFQPMRS
jgi:hypothetical protein